ncbi:MAG: hypothetical protein C3F13_03390 [Anaerolineales bacterium]|nr:hypothetical protein [Anaerolineae bacterium]PWB55729.1 MAG: hypothetical protein C3F13_03390 [Anaerolineales bacterium]
MKSKQRTYWWIDAILFTGFLVAFFLSFTGVELHQWIGVIGGLLALYHLLLHMDWVEAVSQRFLKSANGNVQLKYLIDGTLLAGFSGIVGTGLVISSWLKLALTNYSTWLYVHILASIITLLVLVIKLAMHWKWIARAVQIALKRQPAVAYKPTQLQPVPATMQGMDRRAFLRVMGVAGGASMFALLSATKSLAGLQSDVTTSSVLSSTNANLSSVSDNSSYSQFSSSFYSGTGSCSIQCGKRCAYPGHCRRYTDADGDNYCDLGECS